MNKKTVLITGAGTGLGKKASIELAKRGHKVIATTHYEEEATIMNEIALKENIDIIAFKLDILEENDRLKILKYDIDVFIANAAIGDSGSVSEVFVSRIEEVFNTNVFANMKLAQIVLAQMIKSNKKGRIIFLSSLAGRIPMPFLAPYCASKAAIESLATCLRNEMKLLKDVNIEIAVIEPGAYATGFNKENNEKKYNWMEKESYFIKIVDKIKYYEEKIWNFIEVKPYTSIIKRYIKVVEAKKLRHRYSAPIIQTFFVQLGRIIGM